MQEKEKKARAEERAAKKKEKAEQAAAKKRERKKATSVSGNKKNPQSEGTKSAKKQTNELHEVPDRQQALTAWRTCKKESKNDSKCHFCGGWWKAWGKMELDDIVWQWHGCDDCDGMWMCGACFEHKPCQKELAAHALGHKPSPKKRRKITTPARFLP